MMERLFTTSIEVRSTSAFAMASGSPKRVLNRLSAVGGSYDNALAETINGLYKAEPIHWRTAWKTRESVELALTARLPGSRRWRSSKTRLLRISHPADFSRRW